MQSLKKIHAWAQMKVPLCCNYTPANFVCGGYTVFTLCVRECVRACVHPSVTFCFFNILKGVTCQA